MTTLDSLQKIKSKLEEIKPNFEKYISNKDISLEERWAVFSAAPSELKKHYNYICRFDCLDKDFILPDGPIHMERGEKKDTLEMIEQIKEHLQDIQDDMFIGPSWAEKALKDVNLDILKEEIMFKNIGSFEYDW